MNTSRAFSSGSVVLSLINEGQVISLTRCQGQSTRTLYDTLHFAGFSYFSDRSSISQGFIR